MNQNNFGFLFHVLVTVCLIVTVWDIKMHRSWFLYCITTQNGNRKNYFWLKINRIKNKTKQMKKKKSRKKLSRNVNNSQRCVHSFWLVNGFFFSHLFFVVNIFFFFSCIICICISMCKWKMYYYVNPRHLMQNVIGVNKTNCTCKTCTIHNHLHLLAKYEWMTWIHINRFMNETKKNAHEKLFLFSAIYMHSQSFGWHQVKIYTLFNTRIYLTVFLTRLPFCAKRCLSVLLWTPKQTISFEARNDKRTWCKTITGE